MKTSEPTTILCCVLTQYERHGWVSKEIAEFLANFPIMAGGYAARFVFAHNYQPAASARNIFCQQGKDAPVDWLCMMDNDMAVPLNVFDTIKDAPSDAGIVVPSFYLWDQTESKAKLCWGMDPEPPRDANGNGHFAPGYHELSKCGTGVIFIRPWVFQKLEFPYFRYLYNESAGMSGTEDIQFCLAARKAGVKIYGLAGLDVGHWHTVNISSIAKLLYNPLDNPAEQVDTAAQKAAERSSAAAPEDSVPVEA